MLKHLVLLCLSFIGLSSGAAPSNYKINVKVTEVEDEMITINLSNVTKGKHLSLTIKEEFGVKKRLEKRTFQLTSIPTKSELSVGFRMVPLRNYTITAFVLSSSGNLVHYGYTTFTLKECSTELVCTLAHSDSSRQVCIGRQSRCNGIVDCVDSSDEQNCKKSFRKTSRKSVTKCVSEQADAKQLLLKNGADFFYGGARYPMCEPGGFFEPMQCRYTKNVTVQYCECVRTDGFSVKNITVAVSNSKQYYTFMDKCKRLRKTEIEKYDSGLH